MLKQVILVPMWLGMSPGKIASQCCHVAVPFEPGGVQKRIILKVDSVAFLNTIKVLIKKVSEATGYQPTWYAFVDSEPTTEGTAGKVTAVSLIGRDDIIDEITGTLELY